ncbi:hypothetical protein DEU56DRAFT_911333 [Suillus clintonianus]|uniref:uncharacterized protein n=1 Tax=Suillus clintonianus TaxID=1904413 RepID=UPI001B87E19D|nr:uncharacterized protein DEU56DRAFT_911333 [Suillus clintonianus]KAG2141227.1 hypothetical protein DEU56DRAFT_911333 [Suillus clintonianus]
MPQIQTFDDSDGENFEAENDAVSDVDEASDGEDPSGDELETLRTILTVPRPEAPMHEALETAQQAYNSLRVEFKALKKDYLVLSATVPARSRNRALNKTSALDMKITAEGKKYTLFYHFWVIPGVFPTTPQPDNDPHSPTRWASPEAKLNGAMAELYNCVSKDLHKSMEKYTAFDSLFRAAVSAERSNIVHTIKSCASLIFSTLKLDPTLFSSQTDTRKRDDHDLLHLLKKNGEGEYIRLAPILFARPDTMVAKEFLKNPVLVKIIRVEMYGKKILSGKTKGQKARGQRCNAQCVTEGLIAGAAVMARFLLTHDPEFTATGAETKISYQADYNFYLERLFKRTPWACSVIDFFNKEVFDVTSRSLVPTSDDFPSATQARTWEDDLLDELDAPVQIPSALTSLPTSSAVVDVASSYRASISVNHGPSTSATAQLQLGVSQLTLDSGAVAETTASAIRSVSAHQPRVRTASGEPAHAPEPEPVKRVTRHGGSNREVASKPGPKGKGRGKR